VIVAFLGPSLPAPPNGFTVWPPARQGDVWRALDKGATAIALVDGVFESAPSVWHREILDALGEGVPVVGGASMGALRAAELWSLGMEGSGRIFEWYRSGAVIDDSEVALLHGDAENGYRALTVPQVNVRWSALEAVRRGEMKRRAALELIEASGRIFYQDRTLARVLPLLPSGFRLLDLKAKDARAVLAAAKRARPPAGRAAASSTLSLRSRLPALPYDPGAADAGLRRALLAGHARELGLWPAPRELRAAEERWQRALGVRDRRGLLRRSGLRQAEVERLCEELALERLALDHAGQWLSAGPSPRTALADELRLRGYFAGASGAGPARKQANTARRRGGPGPRRRA
jgi:hypothetical protein